MSRVLIACEESQTVCKAFRELGHEAYSCDIQECSGGHPEWHIQGCALKAINEMGPWDLVIAHPPCTYLSWAGEGWFNEDRYGDKARQRKRDRESATEFFLQILNSNVPRIAVENPAGYVQKIRKPTQTIQPWYFGDPQKKRTLLWLRNLPRLNGQYNAKEPAPLAYYKNGPKAGKAIHWCDMISGKDRQKKRSVTFPGIARAMAEQWGKLLPK